MASSTSFTGGDGLSASIPHNSYLPRVAIVTGAAQGIGYRIAHQLADDGIYVAVNDITAKTAQIDKVVKELQKKGHRALGVPADVTSEREVSLMIEKTAEELGSVDIMVANAGIGSLCSFLETSVQQFDSIYAVNVRGIFLCYKFAALQMIKQGCGGRLIGASSSAGKQGTVTTVVPISDLTSSWFAVKTKGTPNLTAYSASKFAIRGLTQTAAIELRRHGITANTYAPGIIYTQELASKPGGDDRNCTAMKQLFGMPPGTLVADEHVVASLVSYLAKPGAYIINGQSISVDGGLRYD